jgi:ribosomal protein S27AE
VNGTLRELEFGREVLAQALGTALGAGLIALIGILVGVLNDVPWGAVVLSGAGLAVVILIGAMLNYFLSAKIAALKGEACPNCGELILAPIAWHGVLGQNMHSNRDCPKCGRPLIYFIEGELAGEWRIDEAEDKRRKRHAESGEVD